MGRTRLPFGLGIFLELPCHNCRREMSVDVDGGEFTKEIDPALKIFSELMS